MYVIYCIKYNILFRNRCVKKEDEKNKLRKFNFFIKIELKYVFDKRK